MFFRTILGLSLFSLVASGLAADFRQFRGNHVDGLAPGEKPPIQLSENSIAWKKSLPGRGLSSPIIVGDRLFVTACSGAAQERLHILAFETASGNLLWHRQFWATGRTVTHQKTCVAAPTPCSDGKRVFASFSSNDIICVDLDGNLQWCRGLTWDYPNASNSLGMSSSPIIVGKTLIVMAENDDESFSTGLDVATGETRWHAPRPRAANWTSPAIWRGKTPDEDRVLIQSSQGVVAMDPDSGKVEWTYSDGAATIPSLVVAEQVAYVPSHGLTAIQPGRSNPNVPEILWQSGALSPSVASPVVHEQQVYVINRAGVLTCADRSSGDRLWQLRLTGPFSGSPIIANGHAYVANEKGLLQVARIGQERGSVVSALDLGETILCTPAISGNAIYLRSDGHLWKVAE